MHRIGWILFFLGVVGWLACQLPVDAPHADAGAQPSARESADSAQASHAFSRAEAGALSWRRTRSGWERPRWFIAQRSFRQPSLHPAVVGLLQLFVSLTALVALPRGQVRKSIRVMKPQEEPRNASIC